MAENFIPEANSDAPNSLTLLDIIKTFNSVTGKQFNTRFTNVNNLLSDSVRPLFKNLKNSPYTNAELGAILTQLTKQSFVNTQEILFLHRLIALLTFELLNQGIDIKSKELIENLEIYLNK